VLVPDWILFVFIFGFGCCIGSFLNVVVYRLPRDKSLVRPASACPACGKPIRFYDNIPLVSWLLLGGRCRYCRTAISARYFIIELLTGLALVGLFYLYRCTEIRAGLGGLADGRWLVYVVHIALVGGFIAASAIDLEMWVIPLSICWFVTAAGLAGSTAAAYIIDPALIREHGLLPWATLERGSLALGAAVGTGISMLLLTTGVIKRSYDTPADDDSDGSNRSARPQLNHRLEVCKEILFLLPVLAGALAGHAIAARVASPQAWASFHLRHPALSGLLGSLFGYFVGCGIVWAVRILGTLGFGKEAMGLGDVHLMGSAGAVVGPWPVALAFFIAPFFGLAWAGGQMFFKKIRQIPYGPFLSLAVLAVMIFHDWLLSRVAFLFSG